MDGWPPEVLACRDFGDVRRVCEVLRVLSRRAYVLSSAVDIYVQTNLSHPAPFSRTRRAEWSGRGLDIPTGPPETTRCCRESTPAGVGKLPYSTLAGEHG